MVTSFSSILFFLSVWFVGIRRIYLIKDCAAGALPLPLGEVPQSADWGGEGPLSHS